MTDKRAERELRSLEDWANVGRTKQTVLPSGTAIFRPSIAAEDLCEFLTVEFDGHAFSYIVAGTRFTRQQTLSILQLFPGD